MSFEWTSQPLSINSIVNQYTLPVAIRTTPGFRGSNRPLILYSISRVTFAFGRALRANQSTTNGYTTYAPIDSEIVSVPMKYPGYFECIPSSRSGQENTGVTAETNILSIVEKMQVNPRSQVFYIVSPLRVYTLEMNADGFLNRVWHQLEPCQIILFEKIVNIEYLPTKDDNITDDDYELSWWFCFPKQISIRNEDALQCTLSQQQICYISCSSTDEINLIPVGQYGSTNVNKLQTIQNLVERFSIPTNIKLAQLPGSYAYTDFPGGLQLLGSRSEDLAICASLTTTNIALIPKSTPLKFIVSLLSPSSSSQIRQVLSSCHIFEKSFDVQIHQILMSSYYNNSSRRLRVKNSKGQTILDDQVKKFQRSQSIDQNSPMKDDQTATTTTDDGYRSGSSAPTKRNNYRKHRSTSVDVKSSLQNISRQRTLSTDEDSKSDIRQPYPTAAAAAAAAKKIDSVSPPPLPKKPSNFPFPPTSDHEANLIEDIDSIKGNGAILMDAGNELFLALPSDSRFT